LKIMRKNVFKLMAIAVAAVMTISSCKKDEEEVVLPPPTTGGPEVELADGYYVYSGDITSYDDITAKGVMVATFNEKENSDPERTVRATMMETYQEVSKANGFYVIKVTNKFPDYIASVDADTVTAHNDEPKEGVFKGSTVADSAAFSVYEDGVYHIVIDTDLEYVTYAKANWGAIGAATPEGWGASTPFPFKEADATKIVWEGTGIEMATGGMKFRYSNGWKIFLGEDENAAVAVNTNVGGSLDALEPGGADINWETAGVYTMTLTYTFGTGFTIVTEKTGDVVIPEYPEAMYIVGDATAYGWDAPGGNADAIMHKAAGGTPTNGLFWKICHIEGGLGFKLSAADWKEPNIGFAQVNEFDAAGEAVTDNGGNMSIATSGMYMVVLDLRNEMTKVSVVPAEVYGIGDAFGGWDAGIAGNLFTVDDVAKTITSPAVAAAASHRMYASHAWIPDWWNAEFVVNTGVIEYRNDSDSDPTAVAVTDGQVITLIFDDNTGSIQ
jgi:hypothetical protein